MKLPPAIAEAGYRVVSLTTTESTNDDALKAARAGDPGLLWVVAEEQRSGRGRHGRPWVSPPGNLYASLLLVEPCDAAAAPQLGFVAGLALHEAVEAVTGIGAPRLALKWPNDLLLDGAKLSGLLLEGHRVGGALAVIIGFGVNIASRPEGTPYPATSLHSVRPYLDPEQVLSALSERFATIYGAWQAASDQGAADSFSDIRRRWLERAAGLGSEVTLRLPIGERRGVFEGLDVMGRLRLRTGSGQELIDAGDLYFPGLRNPSAALDVGAG